MAQEIMDTNTLIKFWPLIHSVVQEFLAIIEPCIEEAAIRNNIPIELYYYGELGLDCFSIKDFQMRDPFSNPEKFERLFPLLEMKGWIIPIPHNGSYKVTAKTRDGVLQIIQAGDECLSSFDSVSELDLGRLVAFLKQIVTANQVAVEPPQKWAINKRFRVANAQSPLTVQIREYLMDLFAYRDDSHLAAARPHFNEAGIVWSVLGSVASGNAVTAKQMSETMAFRGYDVHEYEVAIRAAVEVGWLEQVDHSRVYRPTSTGKQIRSQVEQLTDEYYYRPWATFSQNDMDEFYELLIKLRDQLHAFKKFN